MSRCGNPECRHDAVHHLLRTRKGACAITGCGCKRLAGPPARTPSTALAPDQPGPPEEYSEGEEEGEPGGPEKGQAEDLDEIETL